MRVQDVRIGRVGLPGYWAVGQPNHRRVRKHTRHGSGMDRFPSRVVDALDTADEVDQGDRPEVAAVAGAVAVVAEQVAMAGRYRRFGQLLARRRDVVRTMSRLE